MRKLLTIFKHNKPALPTVSQASMDLAPANLAEATKNIENLHEDLLRVCDLLVKCETTESLNDHMHTAACLLLRCRNAHAAARALYTKWEKLSDHNCALRNTRTGQPLNNPPSSSPPMSLSPSSYPPNSLLSQS